MDLFLLPFELLGGCSSGSCSFTRGCSSAYCMPLASYTKQILLFAVWASEHIGHVYTSGTRLLHLSRSRLDVKQASTGSYVIVLEWCSTDACISEGDIHANAAASRPPLPCMQPAQGVSRAWLHLPV